MASIRRPPLIVPPLGSEEHIRLFLSRHPPNWDWSRIAATSPGKLFQGTMPPPGPHVREAGFDVLVLCAVEYQPRASAYPGVHVHHAPNNDDGVTPPTANEMLIAAQAAREVSKHLALGKSVLVTCRMGLNRSGLVSALALHHSFRVSGKAAAERVRKAREGALGNKWFASILEAIP